MSYAHHIGADEIDEPLMVPGYGALCVVPPRYVAANDNRPAGRAQWTVADWEEFVKATELGEHCGPPSPAWPQDDLAATTFAPPSDLPRHGDYLQTYTGRTFHPMDPRADEVHIEDIAHSLSLQCRYAGHCIRFYSVAEHSVLMAWWLYRHAGPQTALAALLHDASEAFLVDVPRPVKPFLAGYKDAEAKVMAAVCERFGLPGIPAAVKEADDRIIGDEMANMKPMAWHARYDRPLGVTLAYWEPAEAERRFLSAFTALSDEVKGMEV